MYVNLPDIRAHIGKPLGHWGIKNYHRVNAVRFLIYLSTFSTSLFHLRRFSPSVNRAHGSSALAAPAESQSPAAHMPSATGL